MIALIRRTYQLFTHYQPFTTRGLIALIFASLALYYLAVAQSDLVAYVLGAGVLGTLVLTLIGLLLTRLRLRRSLKAELRFPTSETYSQRDLDAGILLEGSSVWPFFSMILKRRFVLNGPNSPHHRVRGNHPFQDKRYLLDHVYFPHRGIWEIDGLELSLEDDFGFFHLSWFHPLHYNVEVSPPLVNIRPLPVLASSSRSGDELGQTRERSGDLFDLKPYDPSDGITRILWKTYARTGELVVRRPEPAIVPEGEVAMFLLANDEDDHVAAALLDYVKQLDRHNIVTLFASDGAFQGHLDSESGVVSDPEEIRHVVNACALSEKAGSGTDFKTFLDVIEESGRSLHQVIVFASATRDEWLDTVNTAAAQRNIKLVAALVEKEILPQFSLRENNDNTVHPLRKFLGKTQGTERSAGVSIAERVTSNGGEVVYCESTEMQVS